MLVISKMNSNTWKTIDCLLFVSLFFGFLRLFLYSFEPVLRLTLVDQVALGLTEITCLYIPSAGIKTWTATTQL